MLGRHCSMRLALDISSKAVSGFLRIPSHCGANSRCIRQKCGYKELQLDKRIELLRRLIHNRALYTSLQSRHESQG